MVCFMENPKVIQMRLWAVSEFWTQLNIEKSVGAMFHWKECNPFHNITSIFDSGDC